MKLKKDVTINITASIWEEKSDLNILVPKWVEIDFDPEDKWVIARTALYKQLPDTIVEWIRSNNI